MTLAQDTQHTAESLTRLLQQFHDKPAIEAWIASYATQVQLVENALYSLLAGRFLETAIGVQLDGLGEIVGIARNAFDDEAYRDRIKVEILINLSSGTIEDILTIVSRLVDGGLILTEGPYAEFTIELVESVTTEKAQSVAAVVRKIKAAGVAAWLSFPTGAGPFFSFGPDPDADGDSAGFDVGAFISSERV